MLRTSLFVVLSWLLPLGAQAADLYVGTFYDSLVRKFSSTGANLGTFCDTGSGYLQTIALDSHGNLYAPNYYTDELYKFSSTGAYLGVITTGVGQYSLAVDHHDNVYVSKGSTIQRFRSDGANLGTFFSGLAGTVGGLAFDNADNLYVVNRDYGIVKVSPLGTQLGAFPFAAGTASPNGLAIDRTGNIYVSDYTNNAIYKLGPEGTDLGIFVNTGLNHPVGIAFDENGNLYAANDGFGYSPPAYESTIHKFGPTGQDLGTFASTGHGTGPETLAFIPVPVTGDYNQNGVVDAADYVAWRKGVGATYSKADFEAWRSRFGQTPSRGAGVSANATVPEPSTLFLLGIGAISLLGYRKAKSHG